MGMINLGSSMRYGPTGKKRKTTAWNSKKKNTIMAHAQGKLKPSLQEQQRLQQMKEHNEKRQEEIKMAGQKRERGQREFTVRSQDTSTG
mgnify:CR=1 FL=1